MSKKSHHFLTLWPWPLTYDLEKLVRSGHYHYQCVYQIWEQSIPWFLSYRVNTIAGGGRLRRKTITSPDPSDTGDIMITIAQNIWKATYKNKMLVDKSKDFVFSGNIPSPSKKNYSERQRMRKILMLTLILATIPDDTRNILNLQYITPNSEIWDYSDIPGGGT